MDMTKKEYDQYIKDKQPRSPLGKDALRAFWVGGLICALGQAIALLCGRLGLGEEETGAATAIALVFLGALLTGCGVYDDLARYAGAGTLVPITGFANAVAAPALEFKREGLIGGTCAKMFVIAGPVIVYGIGASVLYGLLLVLLGAL